MRNSIEASYWKGRWEKLNEEGGAEYIKMCAEIQAASDKVMKEEMEQKMEAWVKVKERKKAWNGVHR